uniref:Uncharacterized protein n=1 Tax=viral metagenome TaxID=1070528 RepID=A0A6M3M2R1_9ZZZZ
MSTAEIIQTVLIFVQAVSLITLVVITAKYARQTQRQADFMELARQDKTLNDLLSWTNHIYEILYSKDINQRYRLALLFNESIVLCEVCIEIDQKLGRELLETQKAIPPLIEHLKQFPAINFPNIDMGIDIDSIERVNAERVAMVKNLGDHLFEICKMVSILKTESKRSILNNIKGEPEVGR